MRTIDPERSLVTVRSAVAEAFREHRDLAIYHLTAKVVSREVTKKWKMPAREWSAAKAQFAVVFGDRFQVNH